MSSAYFKVKINCYNVIHKKWYNYDGCFYSNQSVNHNKFLLLLINPKRSKEIQQEAIRSVSIPHTEKDNQSPCFNVIFYSNCNKLHYERSSFNLMTEVEGENL